MPFFQLYQYVVPLVLLPLGYTVWLQHQAGNHTMAVFALSFPIVFAYVIPGIGTNWLRLWEFNTRFRLGRFRPLLRRRWNAAGQRVSCKFAHAR